MHLANLEHPLLVIVRSRDGILHDKEEPIYALFMLISEEKNARQHLRMLAQIAVSVDAEGFLDIWRTASNEQALKEILLRDERYISLHIRKDAPSKTFIGKVMSEVELPSSALVVLIRREASILIPHGSTVLHDDDRLTIIGDPKDIRKLYWQYTEKQKKA
jgi:Trk K+ transport system NAD-binding subunit